jgi:hypothetical protein
VIRALVIDFAPAHRRPPAAGLAVLAAAFALAAGLGLQYRSLARDIERMEAALEARQPVAARRAAAAQPVSSEASAELARVTRAVRQISTPWNALFAGIEDSVGENVALLGIQPDPAAARVTITAEARNYGEALWFAQRLSSGGALADAFLTGHELRRDGSLRPVRVTISARWPALEGALADGPAGERAADARGAKP